MLWEEIERAFAGRENDTAVTVIKSVESGVLQMQNQSWMDMREKVGWIMHRISQNAAFLVIRV